MVEDNPLLCLSVSDALVHRDDIDIVTVSRTSAAPNAWAEAGGVDVALLAMHVGSGPPGFDVVPPVGFEPTAFCSGGRRSIP
jgi:hypothetical protein